MRRKNAKLLIFAIILVIIGVVIFAYSKISNNSSNTNENETNPSAISKPEGFVFYDADGNELAISNYEGTPIVLIFFSTDTEYSFNVIEIVKEVYEDYKDEITFLVINTEEKTTDVVETMEACGYSFPIYYDTENLASKYYSYMKLPTIIYINTDGTISQQKEGETTKDSFLANLDLLIENY